MLVARGRGCGGTHAPAPTVRIDEGVVRGEVDHGVQRFLGIPYAALPVGHRRWAAPEPPAGWRGVRDATRFANHCPQVETPFGVASVDEDCLYVNVFAPAHGSPEAPVIVWFHGGSLVTGESDDYDPSGLVREGAVVVTVNYRLDGLGFLATSTLANEDHGRAGNYGLLDQQQALRWVQANIARFGGDPDRVTIAGESAGGLGVLSHLVSPPAEGLFDAAIVQSGTYAHRQPDQDAAESSGAEFAAAVGCPEQDVDCLRAVPVTAVLAAQASGYVPHVDGRIIPESILDAVAQGHTHPVPVMNGSNRDEWRLIVAILNVLSGNPVTAENYRDQFGVGPAIAELIAAQYPLTEFESPALAVGAVGTDFTYACSALSVNQQLSDYTRVYAYEFNDRSAPQTFLPAAEGFSYGASHASELQYLFDLSNVDHPATLNRHQQRLASAMRRSWVRFARTGSPGWPAFTRRTDIVRNLALGGRHVTRDFASRHHCDFWASIGG
ncbi:MAG TPA: carboxylesterase family protein [Aeromicrobium sp.]|nr:carboxylesterase family protein [Aeromicrobium sp.]